MGVKFTNNAEAQLAAGINTSVTTLTLQAGEGALFPVIVSGSGDYFYATLVDISGNREIVKVTERQNGTDVFQVMVRGQDGTSGTAFSTNDKVQLRLPSVVLEEYETDIDDHETRITTIEATVQAPAGTKMWFYQDTAPNAWTLDAGPADSLLAVKGGSEDYNTSGGATAGSWTPTGHIHAIATHQHGVDSHTHTGPSHTHTGPAHTHTLAHTHVAGTLATQATGLWSGTGGGPDASAENHTHEITGSTGAASTETTSSSGTGATGASGTGATGGTALTTNSNSPQNTNTGAEDGTDRPQAAVGVMATKD